MSENENEEKEQTPSEEDELASALPLFKKRLRRLQVAVPIALLLVLGLLAGSIYVVIYSGSKSMQAFEELPQYQVNMLIKGYRQTVSDFDESMKTSRNAFLGEETTAFIEDASNLADFMLDSEDAQLNALLNYRKVMIDFADKAGGTLEWKKYFLAEIDGLITNSRDRKEAIITLSGRFPEVDLTLDD